MMNDLQDSILSKIEFDDKDILEVGCGEGGFTLKHLPGAKSILGIDTNNEAIEALKKKWPDYLEGGPFVFLERDIKNFPLQAEGFDIAIFSNSF